MPFRVSAAAKTLIGVCLGTIGIIVLVDWSEKEARSVSDWLPITTHS